MSIDPVAQQGFSAAASEYESSRPGYPAVAVAWLVEQLRLDQHSVVGDVGAGTGKLTRLLMGRVGRVIAVERV